MPEPARPLVREALRIADERRLRVHLVGGPVRDWLMGRALRDVDLCVEPREGVGAPDLARALEPGGLRARIHERFGTVALSDGNASIDLATARSERYAHPGALPEVAPATLEEDLRRRDFTVNAMSLPLSQAARAKQTALCDPWGGRDDLAQARLRVLHDQSFRDDPTRALRAARLAARLDFGVARETRRALRGALRDGAFGRVSGDRWRREFARLWSDAPLGLDPARGLRALHDWHVLAALEPGLTLEREAVAPLRRLGRSLAGDPWPRSAATGFVAGMGLWLRPCTPALRRRVLRRLSVRGDRADRIVGLGKECDVKLRVLARSRGRGQVDAALSGLDDDTLLALHAIAEPAARRRIARWATQDRARSTPLTGDDLVALGLSGPAVGRALRRVRAAWLDGGVRNRDEALALAHEIQRRGRRKRS